MSHRPKVFISYAHDSPEHREAVRGLWTFLRSRGIDATLDLSAARERQDWSLWMAREIDTADFVLVVASPAYRRRAEGTAEPDDGRGVQFEAALLRDRLTMDRPRWIRRMLPVVLPGRSVEELPAFLQPYAATSFPVTEFTDVGAEQLLRVLTGQELHPEPPLGPLPVLPPATAPTIDTGPAPVAGQPALADLPAALRDLLHVMAGVAEDPLYPQRGRRVSLSSVYVQQSVAAPTEVRRWREEDEFDEPVIIEDDRRASRLAQPFDEVVDQHEHLVIEGAAGLGKSTLGRHLVGELIAALRDPGAAAPLGTPLVPLMLPARVVAAQLREDRTWGQVLQAAASSEYAVLADSDVPARQFTEPVRGLRWLVVIDALDEVPDPAVRDRLVTALALRMSAPGPARFVVTTRPLAPGEIERIQGASVGFYELQPFDRPALEMFAHRWFDPEETAAGARLSAEFLGQVDDAGLGGVLTVPLLARVAAEVFENSGDRRLPSSRYELYTRYVDQYAQVRAGNAEAALETLHRLPGGPEVAGWLRAHRDDLLEELATAYTTSETPLLEVAERVLPASAGLPPGWENPVAEWLSQTGLLSRHGPRVRFLHQTFAEHLAATATAKRLPPAFDPTHPEWEALIRAVLLGDESAERVLLHRLHLHPDEPDLLNWLQGGTRDQQECASDLIGQGAPCTPAQIDRQLTMAEEQVLSGAAAPELKSIAGLVRHPWVRDRLWALFTADEVSREARITLVELLADRLLHARHEGATRLLALLDEPAPAQLHRRAAAVLAKLGPLHRERAAEVLRRLSASTSVSPFERLEVITELTKLGASYRPEAAGLLHRIATDGTVSHWERHLAAAVLAKFGGEWRGAAARALVSIVDDVAAYHTYRTEAGQALAQLGGVHRDEAVRAFGRMATDPTLDNGERLLARATAATLEFRGDQRAAALWAAAATDPTVHPWDRTQAALGLARLGAESRADAIDILLRLAADPTHDPFQRLNALSEVRDLGRSWRRQVGELLAGMAVEPTTVGSTRLSMAQQLARLGSAHHEPAGQAFRLLAIDPTVDPATRATAAREWAKLGAGQVAEVSRWAEWLLSHPLAATEDKILATVVVAALHPDRRVPLAPLLGRLAVAPVVDARSRMQAVDALLEYGPRCRGDAEPALRQLLTGALDGTLQDNMLRQLLTGDDDRRALAIDAFTRLATDPHVDWHQRQRALTNLIELGGEVHATAVEVLRSACRDRFLPTWHRRSAGSTLATLDEPGREWASQILTWLSRTPTVPADERIDAAHSLYSIGGEAERAMAGELLIAFATDERNPLEHRVDAARRLLQLDPTGHGAALAVLDAIGTDDTAPPIEQALALTTLARYAADQVAPALAAQRRMPDDPRTPWWRLSELMDELGKLTDVPRQHVAEVWVRVAADPTVPAYARRIAAEALSPLGSAHRDQAVSTYRAVLADPRADAHDRREVAQRLARLGGPQRSFAHEQLAAVAIDPAVPPQDRRQAVQLVADGAPALRSRMADALLDLVVDPTVALTERCEAASHVVRLGIEPAGRLVELMNDVLRHPHSAPADRVVATYALATVSPLSGAAAAATLRRLAEEPLAPADRRAVGRLLTGWGAGAHPGDARSVSAQVAADPTADAGERLAASTDLARLDATGRDEAVRLLAELAGDGTLAPEQRRLAAEELGRLRPAMLPEVVGQLREIVAIPTASTRQQLDGLSTLAGLVDDEGPVAGMLAALAADPTRSVPDRCLAAGQLAAFGGRHHDQAVELLHDMTEEWASAWVLLPAIRTLVAVRADRHRTAALCARALASPQLSALERAGLLVVTATAVPEYHEAAVERLRELAADPTAHPDDRYYSISLLGELGLAASEQATLIHALATDPRVDTDTRRRAAMKLGTDGPEAVATAIGALTAITDDDDSWCGYQAAEALSGLGPPGLAAGRAALRRMATGGRVDPYVRRAAALALAALGTRPRAEAAAALAGQARDARLGDHDRLTAARLLTGLGADHRRTGTEILAALAAQPAVPRLTHALAVAALAGIVGSHRYDAVELLVTVAADAGCDPADRIRAVDALLALGTAHRDRAARLLTAMATDERLRGWYRRLAAESLARLGATHRAAAGVLLTDLSTDERLDPWERAEAAVARAVVGADRAGGGQELARIVGTGTITPAQRRYAVTLLVRFGPSARPTVVTALREIAADPNAEPEHRRSAAADLGRLGRPHRTDAGELLRTLADATGHSPLDRALARSELAHLDPNRRGDATRALGEVAAGAGPVLNRLLAAAALADHEGDHRGILLAPLRKVAADPTGQPSEAALALFGLARLDPATTSMSEATTALRNVLDGPADDDAGRRRLVAEQLGDQPEHRAAAVSALRTLVTGSANADGRLAAANSLAEVTGATGRVCPDDLRWPMEQ
ncbi:TIR domain-containing protein [Micromonospora sp. PLK6-60]|uniref:TIR domain-containing protein n=1 Tax=Micromonospora sp. PLK6-60 TaxID=2873383 RepID=UPI001CA6C992|nr:TIR domain-containing protein [Micromonospora sp. PLK6-60]MBY8872149.1 TIR domain-containing protein [Micromonospora sp. PLK6-60]